MKITCEVCGGTMKGKRKGAKTCSSACRTIKWATNKTKKKVVAVSKQVR